MNANERSRRRFLSLRTTRIRSLAPAALVPAMAAVAIVGFTAAGAQARPAARPAPQDVAATRAYLRATNTWTEAQLANAAQSTAAVEATAARITAECPGIVVAPGTVGQLRSVRGVGTPPKTNYRALGESNRKSKQRGELQIELSLTLEDAALAPNREAAGALIHSVAALRWSNPVVTFLVHLGIASTQETLALPAAPPVCADMSAWASSGYKTLAPASKAFATATAALQIKAFELLGIALSGAVQPLPQLLARYETVSDRALERHTAALSAQLAKASAEQSATVKRVEQTVGLAAPTPKLKSKLLASLLKTAKRAVVIAHGRTAVGEAFVVRATSLAHRRHTSGCTVEVSISEPSNPSSGGLGSLLSVIKGGGLPERCLSRSHLAPEPTVHCNAGLLTVEATLSPAARSVRLLLSDNRTIASPAILVPARLGGPAGLYYQVVRGPLPIPVSLTELDAQGNTLGVLKLPAVVECAKQLIKYFPHGDVSLARVSAPQGQAFTIHAKRFRELGRVHFELALEANGEEPLGGEGSGGGEFTLRAEEDTFPSGTRVFAPQTSTGCTPQPYAIVYGLLKTPQDTVLARVAGTLVPLTNVAIPAHLHADGVLAYGVFSPMPTELVSTNAAGTVVSRDDNLSAAAKADTETCEGEAES